MTRRTLPAITLILGIMWVASAATARVAIETPTPEKQKENVSQTDESSDRGVASCCGVCRCGRGKAASAEPSARAGDRSGRGAGRMHGRARTRRDGATPNVRGFARRGRGFRGCGRRCFEAPSQNAAPAGPLDDATGTALRDALLDEYANELYYAKVMEVFGEGRPFSNLHAAEQRHAAAVLSLFERYGLEPPERDEAEVPAVPETIREAIALAVERERANVALFDRVMEKITQPDIRQVFERLRDASANRHLPALERRL